MGIFQLDFVACPAIDCGILLGQKTYAEAEPLLLAGYEGMKAREAKVPKPRLTQAGERIVKLYEAWGQPEKAAEWRAKLDRKFPDCAGCFRQVTMLILRSKAVHCRQLLSLRL